jgi:hypothetical protein
VTARTCGITPNLPKLHRATWWHTGTPGAGRQFADAATEADPEADPDALSGGSVEVADAGCAPPVVVTTVGAAAVGPDVRSTADGSDDGESAGVFGVSGDGSVVPEPVADGVGDSDGVGDPVSDGDGESDGEGDPESDGEGDGEGDPDPDGVGEGDPVPPPPGRGGTVWLAPGRGGPVVAPGFDPGVPPDEPPGVPPGPGGPSPTGTSSGMPSPPTYVGESTASKMRVAPKRRDHHTVVTRTTSPVLGACTIFPLPRYIATWWMLSQPDPDAKNSRSPGRSALRGTLLPRVA